jgi:hypothetical protein
LNVTPVSKRNKGSKIRAETEIYVLFVDDTKRGLGLLTQRDKRTPTEQQKTIFIIQKRGKA